jgi:hypothetical protein
MVSATAAFFAVSHSSFPSRHFPFVIFSHPIVPSQQIFQQSFHHPRCWDNFYVIVKESKEARCEDDLSLFQLDSHFLIPDKEVAFLYTKEVAMRRSRAPPAYWGIYTQSDRFLHINNEKAAHPPWCAALFVIHSTLPIQVRLLT